MNLKSIFLVVLLLFSLSVFAQNNSDWISTKAVIKSIEKKGGKRTKEIATITFTTKEGKSIETMVELERIPLLGSFKSAGDEITINYNPANPALAATNVGNFLYKYGMYILIALGVVFSVMQYRKAMKKSYK